MKALFIADAHLKNSDDFNYQKLLKFLSLLVHPSDCGTPSNAEPPAFELIPVDDLYIGGDFFDFWFCRGAEVYPEFLPVINALTAIRKRGIRVHFAEGNHDFFLSDYFTRILDMEVFSEWGILALDDHRVLFSHGDTADRSNIKYLLLRKLLRSRLIYQLQRRMPLSFLWKIAGLSSAASRGMFRTSEDKLSEILHALSALKIRGDVDAVILGHCHKPVMKEFDVNGRRKYTITLGDWIRHFSYLYYADGVFRLCFFDTEEDKTAAPSLTA
ncbi:MAG: UDP-2,3-diacylglucosamine hydrolase [Syntrophus sp. PtaB.Bin001]|nr:MAG: UDP-2,3-diacylglucosamine hydrolase [Syntrophus sp. PtaB.Bin001]